jgi:hypothetical protein
VSAVYFFSYLSPLIQGKVIRGGGSSGSSLIINNTNCFDSDNGLNYSESGYVEETSSIGSWDTCLRQIKDVCVNVRVPTNYQSRTNLTSTTAFAIASPIDYKNVTYLKEQYCNGTKAFSKLYLCPFGCRDGACTPPLCELSYSEGVNSVVRGEVYKPLLNANREGNRNRERQNPVVLARDTCKDNSTLSEARCLGRYDYSTRENYGILDSLLIPCPNGCVDGGCSLEGHPDFCDPKYGCFPITSDLRCEQSGWYNSDNSFIQSSIQINYKRGSGQTLNSYCADSQTVVKYSCLPYTSFDNDYGGFLIPTRNTSTCPTGYSCDGGKCLEQVRSLPPLRGNLDGQDIIDGQDLQILKNLVAQNSPATPLADIDGDGRLDSYDVYLLSQKIATGAYPQPFPIRNFRLSSSNTLYTGWGSEGLPGTFAEYTPDFRSILSQWNVEYSQKGASRMQCVPPVIKINLKNVNRNTRLLGRSTMTPYPQLRYDKFKLIPNCDIWYQYSVDNLLREYFVYNLFRQDNLPELDVIAFANVQLNSTDEQIDPSMNYTYFFLQRTRSSHDQYPFQNQYGFSQILDANSPIGRVISENPFLITVNLTADNSLMQMSFERNTTMRYLLLSELVSLGDRGSFHNEDYGLDATINQWKRIFFDFDLSFDCYYYNQARYVFSNLNLSQSEIFSLKQNFSALLKSFYDDPDNLNKMLLSVDQYPFRANKIKLKNELKLRFYYYALLYGSENFATDFGVPYQPYSHTSEYKLAAQQLVNNSTLDRMCGEGLYALSNQLGSSG